jgi:hypothetical protein
MAPKGDNVVVSNMKLERMLSMKGGKGEASYANNSQAQVSPPIYIYKYIVVFFTSIYIFLLNYDTGLLQYLSIRSTDLYLIVV